MTDLIEWEDGETRTVQWLPQDLPTPADAIDHGDAPGHHAEHSRLIETGTMSHQESSITEHGEPSLIYARRESFASPIQVLIVQDGNTDIYEMSDERALRMAATILHILTTRPGSKERI